MVEAAPLLFWSYLMKGPDRGGFKKKKPFQLEGLLALGLFLRKTI
jgi:hypothetical protein